MGKFVDLTGKRFSKWSVVGRSQNRGNLITWTCRCDCGRVKDVYGRNLTTGKSLSCGKCEQIIYGVGINDLNREVTADPHYLCWKRMIERCYSPKALARDKTYIGAEVADEWKKASNFEQWMRSKNWEGMELDKDLTTLSGKLYSPETCAFVPARVNLALGTSDSKRGRWPLGVCSHAQAKLNIRYNQNAANSILDYMMTQWKLIECGN